MVPFSFLDMDRERITEDILPGSRKTATELLDARGFETLAKPDRALVPECAAHRSDRELWAAAAADVRLHRRRASSLRGGVHPQRINRIEL